MKYARCIGESAQQSESTRAKDNRFAQRRAKASNHSVHYISSFFFSFRKGPSSLSLKKLVRQAEAEPRPLSADDDGRLARGVESKAGRE
jgi:hypothetical protein